MLSNDFLYRFVYNALYTIAMYKCYNRFNPGLIFPRNNGDFGYCSRDQVLRWKYMIIIIFSFDEATSFGFFFNVFVLFKNGRHDARFLLLNSSFHNELQRVEMYLIIIFFDKKFVIDNKQTISKLQLRIFTIVQLLLYFLLFFTIRKNNLFDWEIHQNV